MCLTDVASAPDVILMSEATKNLRLWSNPYNKAEILRSPRLGPTLSRGGRPTVAQNDT